ncbi:magnesium transporter [Salinihabitans flavidus]|uniref:Magnesium transport protein CorA n=1 Tax=Salinihabitans flavidus TaxID=569882 RepID=A0A1H8QXC8_9RHOB|nr:magnesium transporter CorA family protein [Salinihabitans flavidus]SEO58363.1 magnesium transporter [Salinihabitans flavidus]
MINGYRVKGDALIAEAGATGDDVIWIDVQSPAEEERSALSQTLGVTLPSRADQEEIEHSSRLYSDQGMPVMTALLPSLGDGKKTVVAPVTFILTETRLITIRHHDPRPFSTFPDRAGRSSVGCASAEAVLVGLIEEIIDRLADITELAGQQIDIISQRIFQSDESQERVNHRETLREIGRNDELVMHLRESLLTMERLMGYLAPVMETRKADRALRTSIKTQSRDIRTITEQAGFLQQKTALLLEATLGLINIEQNGIIKIFSVAAVAFLPPTLIASIYGMNFEHMPELGWTFGYPLALLLMVASSLGPLLYFRRRGWL